MIKPSLGRFSKTKEFENTELSNNSHIYTCNNLFRIQGVALKDFWCMLKV